MDLTRTVTDQIFTQCVGIIGSEDNQKKLRTHIIDPLVSYFKYKLRFFFVVIIILLCCLLIANILIIGYFINVRSLIRTVITSTPIISSIAS
jgi:hypothetical protein